MIKVLRHIYDLPYKDAIGPNSYEVTLHSLAMIYVTADKYQVEGLKKKVHREIQGHSNRKLLESPQDFLDALEVVITGTTPEDKHARKTMISACVEHIKDLQKSPDFLALMREHGDIGAEIIQHNHLPTMLEGIWYHGDYCGHPEAVPSCRKCERSYPASYVRSHRHLKAWTCPKCRNKEHPVCIGCGGEGGCRKHIKWLWHDQ
jgi:hypothetical protein